MLLPVSLCNVVRVWPIILFFSLSPTGGGRWPPTGSSPLSFFFCCLLLGSFPFALGLAPHLSLTLFSIYLCHSRFCVFHVRGSWSIKVTFKVSLYSVTSSPSPLFFRHYLLVSEAETWAGGDSGRMMPVWSIAAEASGAHTAKYFLPVSTSDSGVIVEKLCSDDGPKQSSSSLGTLVMRISGFLLQPQLIKGIPRWCRLFLECDSLSVFRPTDLWNCSNLLVRHPGQGGAK